MTKYTGAVFIEVGSIWKNCGDSAGQTAAGQSDASFANMVKTNYGTTFSQNQTLFNNLTGELNKITTAGINQQGESPTELAAKNSQAINTAAGQNKQIQQAIGENAGAHGISGAPGVESGVTQAVRAQAATDVENNLSNKEADITKENYDIGRQNYLDASKLTEAAPGAFEDPTSKSADATSSANQVNNAQQNANEQSSTGTELLGLGEGLAADAATAFGASHGGCWIAAEVYGGWSDPRTIRVRHQIFDVWAQTFVGSLVAKLYLAIGKQVAWFVHRSSILRKIFKNLFDRLQK